MLELTKKYLNSNIEELKKKDIKKIQELIKYHSDLYYNKEEPIISDKEYDDLFKLLQDLEIKFWIKEKQTSKVWTDIIQSTFEKVQHSRPMISLDNTYNEEDLNDFNERVIKNLNLWLGNQENIKYTLEFKFDWLGIELIYKEWKLVQAITRGDWIAWEDVTQNIFWIENIPKTINYNEQLEVRWEIVMPISVFDELNYKAKQDWTKVFSNPRNAASWSVRMKDARVTKQRKLKFFAYDLANFEDFRLREKIKDYYDVIKKIEELWFETSSYFKKYNWIDKIIKAIDNFWDLKSTLDFEIDWLVLKVNNISLWNKIGFTEHHPKYAIAYKFPAEIMTTKILSVEHSIWKTWTITPIAHLEPVNIGWVIVKRATLHNYLEVENLDVRIWDNVFLKRAWEVIPKIISVIKENNKNRDEFEKIVPPNICPSCWTEIFKDDDKVRYYCPNKTKCPAQHSEKLIFSVGKQWFNIDWLGEKQVQLFLSAWIIKDLYDIFDLEAKKEEILELEWFQEKSINNLLKWINKAKNIEIFKFITALWIYWVGKKTAKNISVLFQIEDNLINFNYSLEDLLELDDIWPETAKNIIEYFHDEQNINLLKKLINKLNIKYYKNTQIKNWYFSWKKMCITWSFDWYSRDQLIEKLEKNWGTFVSSVSKKTDYLLAWEKVWSKLKKAKDLWVEVIDLDYFFNYIK